MLCSFQRSISRLVPACQASVDCLTLWTATSRLHCVTNRLLNSLDRHQSTALCNQSTDQLSGHASVDYSAGSVDCSAPSDFCSAPSVFCSAPSVFCSL